jgi:hypothetical protein
MPPGEQRRAGDLVGPWTDLLYVPGPGFTSPLEPRVYRSTFFVVPPEGQALRLSSVTVPAFGRDLCRLRVEPVAGYRADRLGSLFEPSRRGLVYGMAEGGTLEPPREPGWAYSGPSLVAQLGVVTRIRIVRERVRGRAADGPCSWQADRGLLLSGAGSEESLILAEPGGEEVCLVPELGPYRVVVDRSAPSLPGAELHELLGYGDWPELQEVTVDFPRLEVLEPDWP